MALSELRIVDNNNNYNSTSSNSLAMGKNNKLKPNNCLIIISSNEFSSGYLYLSEACARCLVHVQTPILISFEFPSSTLSIIMSLLFSLLLS